MFEIHLTSNWGNTNEILITQNTTSSMTENERGSIYIIMNRPPKSPVEEKSKCQEDAT